jgi:hypothetical protein
MTFERLYGEESSLFNAAFALYESAFPIFATGAAAISAVANGSWPSSPGLSPSRQKFW